MLAVSPLRNARDDHQSEGAMEGADLLVGTSEFPDFTDGNLLDSIDFDDLFIGMHDDDVLPDLEMDPELLAEFSASGGEESEIMNAPAPVDQKAIAGDMNNKYSKKKLDGDKLSGSEQSGTSTANLGEEVASRIDESVVVVNQTTPKEADKGGRRPSSHQSKSNNTLQGKRKVKVDWTPELHRRFVQAVEQLGVDKAVPSRILELMGIDCLTRHNIASHLQKYRSHRKHLLAREAEAASWSQRRQMYGAAASVPGGGKREASAWLAPASATMGFPPVTPMPQFRPLHVWGHPTTVNPPLMNVWPKQLPHSPSLPPPPVSATWAPVAPHPPPPPLLPDAPYWHPYRPHVPNALTPGASCFPQTRYVAPPVPGIPPHPMYRVESGFSHPTGPSVSPRSPLNFHPSKESVDAAIGDVLSKPWQPLPLGLKPPSVDGVLGELHRQGIPKIPPSSA